MPIAGQLIVMGLVGMVVAGVVLVLTAFRRRPAEPMMPPAQVVVERSRTPIDPPPSTARHVSGGRIAIGIVLIVLGALGLVFVHGIRGLAELASH